jgi:diacylglycerol kinase (ATP)
MKTQILFIINPKSGVHKKHNIPELIEEYLDNSKFDYTLVYTKYSGHEFKITKDAVSRNIDIVCAIGGDGSVHNVGVALIDTTTKLAIIPTGSGNGFARHFDISTQIRKAILIINQEKTRKIDIGTINNKYFLGVAGFGFDAHIAKSFSKKTSRGLWGYIKLVFKEFFNYKEKEFEIEFDSQSKIKGSAFMLSISNTSEFGNGFCISPHSSVHDGLLELVVLKKPPFHKVPIIAAYFFTRNIKSSPYIRTYRFSNLTLTSASTKSHADGETIALKTPIRIGVKQNALQLIVGENYA